MKPVRKLYLDQYGMRYYATTVKELRGQIAMGKSRVGKMYLDKKDGTTVHCGYVIAGHWLTAYVPYEVKL
jgi:hypothetical protein